MRVLIVEDEPLMAEQLRRGLEREGYAPLLARDAPPDIVDGLDGGADDYLTKPFAFEVLLARLRALSRRVAVAPVPILEVGDLALDPAKHTVTRAGEKVALSTKEFRLLHFLLRRMNQTVRGRICGIHIALWRRDLVRGPAGSRPIISGEPRAVLTARRSARARRVVCRTRPRGCSTASSS